MRIFTFVTLLALTQILNSQDKCLRFFGNGTNDIDRVKIHITSQTQPINIGNSFTIEFQIKALLSENPLGTTATQGSNDDWTLGHIIIDRDIFGNGDYGDYGISLTGGRVAFGVNNGSQSFTIITSSQIPENQWVHVAVTRDHSTGQMRIYVNGVQSASGTGPTGNISYRVGRSTSWGNDPYIVIGAEKHDYDPNTYPSFRGFLDNIRFSNIIRYTSNFTPTSYSADANTVAFYNFDNDVGDIVYDGASNPTNGARNYGGTPAGPIYVGKNDSIFAIQASTNLTTPGSNNNPIICLHYIKSNYPTTVNVQSITFTTNGTANTADITAARVYYTTSPTFSTNTQFGSTVNNPSGSFTITGNQTLSNGGNYFWLVYDIATNANTNNYFDATCTALTINQPPYNLTPSITDPEGAVPLPVELVSFDYKIFQSILILNWITNTETNLYGFEIQKMKKCSNNNFQQWEVVDFISGHGTSNSPKSYSYSVKNLTAGEYFFRLKMIDIDGSFEFSDVLKVNLSNPIKTSLKQNYPNSFNPETVIDFEIATTSRTTIEIFDITGRLIHTLVDEILEPGYYSRRFNYVEANLNLSSGFYIYKMKAIELGTSKIVVESKKMLLIK
jgi:hypothetical protein